MRQGKLLCTLTVRIDEDLDAQITELVANIARRTGVHPSRGDIARLLLERGVAASQELRSENEAA